MSATPYTEAQIAGIEAVAALADQDTTVPRLLANLDAMRAERDAARETAGTLLAILEAVSDRLTAEEAAGVARLVARAARRSEAQPALHQLDDDRSGGGGQGAGHA